MRGNRVYNILRGRVRVRIRVRVRATVGLGLDLGLGLGFGLGIGLGLPLTSAGRAGEHARQHAARLVRATMESGEG